MNIAPHGIPHNIFTNSYNNNHNHCSSPFINPNGPIKFTLVSILTTSSFNMWKEKPLAQSKVNYDTRCNLLWHAPVIRNLFLMKLLKSTCNCKSIFHKCSIACSFALENLSIWSHPHANQHPWPQAFSFLLWFLQQHYWVLRERERGIERSQTKCQFGESWHLPRS